MKKSKKISEKKILESGNMEALTHAQLVNNFSESVKEMRDMMSGKSKKKTDIFETLKRIKNTKYDKESKANGQKD